MAVNKVVLNKNTLIDLTQDTITSEDVLNNKTFHNSDGTIGIGNAPSYDGSYEITQNGLINTKGKYLTDNINVATPYGIDKGVYLILKGTSSGSNTGSGFVTDGICKISDSDIETYFNPDKVYLMKLNFNPFSSASAGPLNLKGELKTLTEWKQSGITKLKMASFQSGTDFKKDTDVNGVLDLEEWTFSGLFAGPGQCNVWMREYTDEYIFVIGLDLNIDSTTITLEGSASKSNLYNYHTLKASTPTEDIFISRSESGNAKVVKISNLGQFYINGENDQLKLSLFGGSYAYDPDSYNLKIKGNLVFD